MVVLMMMSNFEVSAQNSTLKEANEAFENFSYMDAAKIYEELIAKGYESNSIYRNLADSYFYNSNYEKAVHNYEIYISKESKVAPIVLYQYAKSLDASGNSEKAKEYYDRYNKSQSNKKELKTEINLYGKFFTEKKTINYESELSSESSEYPTMIQGNQLYLVSNGLSSRGIDRWTNKPYNSLTYFNEQGELKPLLSTATPFHEGSATIDPSGKNMYVTLNLKGTKPSKKAVYLATLKIVQYVLKNNRWVFEKVLKLNSDQFNSAHPVINSDGSMMYFASDRPGGYGESDLYSVTIDSNGDFGEPENLGSTINTIGRESFPELDQFGQLIFASDGHRGFGGYDLFGVDLKSNNPTVVNLGNEVNSNQDDFSLVFSDEYTGYMASNRLLNSGDDVYSFIFGKPFDFTPKQVVLGTVQNKGLPLANVSIQIMDSKTVIGDVNSEKSGDFELEVIDPSNEAKIVRLYKEGYEPKDVSVPFNSVFQVVELGVIELKKSLESLTAGDDLAKFFEIEMIHFDFDKWDILPASDEDLAKIAEALIQYPELKIEIRSHTDSVGSEVYNQYLSDKRAMSTYDYLIQLGAKASQMTYKGFGESQLIQKCDSCSNDENRKNRRSEFIIVK